MAPQPAPTHRAQTIKQAKAAYKSRNQSTLTEREKKQIERSIELERRAWRVKEAEKRRAEAKAKREEQERKERDGGVSMTSQRRCDRFGFVGSQMHLGAFFGGAGGREGDAREAETGEEEDFGGSLDDESMLDAEVERKAESPAIEQNKPGEEGRSASVNVASRAATRDAQAEDATRRQTSDLDLFWEELDTSTQIARDLATASPVKTDLKPTSPNSFSSGEFDLSVEDIEEAQAKDEKDMKIEKDKKLMPPPALPTNISLPAKASPRPTSNTTSMPPPLRAGAPRAPSRPLAQPSRATLVATASNPPFAPYSGFTMAELESFVDDDIQLTQVDPV